MWLLRLLLVTWGIGSAVAVACPINKNDGLIPKPSEMSYCSQITNDDEVCCDQPEYDTIATSATFLSLFFGKYTTSCCMYNIISRLLCGFTCDKRVGNYSYILPDLVTEAPNEKFEFIEPAPHVVIRMCKGFCNQLFFLCQNRKLLSNELVKNQFTKDTFCNYVSSESFAGNIGFAIGQPGCRSKENPGITPCGPMLSVEMVDDLSCDYDGTPCLGLNDNLYDDPDALQCPAGQKPFLGACGEEPPSNNQNGESGNLIEPDDVGIVSTSIVAGILAVATIIVSILCWRIVAKKKAKGAWSNQLGNWPDDFQMRYDKATDQILGTLNPQAETRD